MIIYIILLEVDMDIEIEFYFIIYLNNKMLKKRENQKNDFFDNLSLLMTDLNLKNFFKQYCSTWSDTKAH